MTVRHVVVGAGPVGTAVALLLADAGHDVRVVTRSGSGPEHPRVARVRADASDAERFREVSAGAAVIYNCVNPPYERWTTDWPPVADSLLAAAQAHDAVLATVSNLYAYGVVDGPISEDTPERPHDAKGAVRARMWADALAAHTAGRVRAVEVRASDFADAGDQSHLARNAGAVLAGRRATVMGSADQPHTWTSTRDVARLLVAAAADPDAHGRVWHVPSNPPRTQREALADLARVAGVRAPRVSVLGPRAVRTLGVVVPFVRELAGTVYQFSAPFVLDDSAARACFGLEPEPWEDVLARVVADARAQRPGRAA
ncbi:NAD-dependent epimerase/dehydratase family protein [Aquipuribacter nitratireducens]|uniref:NAD-dependent epimerase/dehydratase family protein n=1 Tax=Aquipuribacter nitratireducens TaxID=650104 RepID=A0ABW0GTD9_9MICO